MANVLHLPPGDVEGQPPGTHRAAQLGAVTSRGRAMAGRVLPRQVILRRNASDERLLELAGLGDERAWEAIMERHHTYLLACCRPIVGESSAQDAVQQAFISAWHALLRGCEVRNMRAWLATIARRAALQMLREEGPREQPLPAWAEAETQAHNHDELFTRARAALAAVAALPAHERDALVWTSLQGRSTRETASALGVSEGALRQLVFRARARARAAVGSLVPSTLLSRVYGLMSHGTRRGAGGLPGELPAPVALHCGEGLAKLAPVLAAAVLVGAPLAALDLAPHGAGHARKAPATASRQQASTVRARRAPGLTRSADAGTRQLAPTGASPAHRPAAPAGASAHERSGDVPPATRGAAASAAAGAAAGGDARPAAREQRPSAAPSSIPTTITERVPAPAPSLPTPAPPSAPALPLPSVTGVTQPLANTVGQVGQTVTSSTGALLEAGRAVGTAATSALPRVPALP